MFYDEPLKTSLLLLARTELEKSKKLEIAVPRPTVAGNCGVKPAVCVLVGARAGEQQRLVWLWC